VLASPALAGFCYTQLTDTRQEKNGLLTQDRAPKLDPATVRAINRAPSAAMSPEMITFMQRKQPPADI
jgi:hypothetical protein